jgi:Na+/H+ antiporter NhaD/arsenite permease-like protein
VAPAPAAAMSRVAARRRHLGTGWGTRVASGVLVGGLLALAPALASPLGRLGSPFALLVVLPALALALEAFGWSRAAARALGRIGGPLGRLLAAYGVWLATSAVLTLDVAAAAGASVGVDAAGPDRAVRRWHLDAAVLGSNVGSLLFPFSNLTNLVVLGAAGVGLAAFVETAWLPQLGAALAVGALLALQARRSGELPTMTGHRWDGAADAADEADGADGAGTARPSLLAGAVTLAGATGAVVAGLAGQDMAVPFALSAGVLAGAATARRLASPADIARSLPIAALVVVLAAAWLGGAVAPDARLIPHPADDLAGLALALAAGGLLAITLNNLPAAAFGGVWLAHAAVPILVAYLIGTNVAALATPHGSAATMLVRSGGARRGVDLPASRHVTTAWPYALAGSAVALALLALVAR